jgi:hypothetical protein
MEGYTCAEKEEASRSPSKINHNPNKKQSLVEFLDLLVQTPIHNDPSQGLVLLQGQADPLLPR